MTTPIGLIGGTGAEGRGIAMRLAAAGRNLVIGSRDAAKAARAAAEIDRAAGAHRAEGAANAELFDHCEILFLTLPFDHVTEFLKRHREHFRDRHVLVDVTVPLRFQRGPRLIELEAGSAAEHIRTCLPEQVPLVATLKTLPATLLAELKAPLECDEFVCHDSAEARDRVLEELKAIPGIRWLDGGPLRFCRSLEAMTLLVIGLNRRYGSHLGRFRVLGI